MFIFVNTYFYTNDYTSFIFNFSSITFTLFSNSTQDLNKSLIFLYLSFCFCKNFFYFFHKTFFIDLIFDPYFHDNLLNIYYFYTLYILYICCENLQYFSLFSNEYKFYYRFIYYIFNWSVFISKKLLLYLWTV